MIGRGEPEQNTAHTRLLKRNKKLSISSLSSGLMMRKPRAAFLFGVQKTTAIVLAAPPSSPLFALCFCFVLEKNKKRESSELVLNATPAIRLSDFLGTVFLFHCGYRSSVTKRE